MKRWHYGWKPPSEVLHVLVGAGVQTPTGEMRHTGCGRRVRVEHTSAEPATLDELAGSWRRRCITCVEFARRNDPDWDYQGLGMQLLDRLVERAWGLTDVPAATWIPCDGGREGGTYNAE
jgi:hypothetical protein